MEEFFTIRSCEDILVKKREVDFLGTGWGFPPTFATEYKGAQMVSDERDICESLRILLSTQPGERIMQPDYGCHLHYLLFEPLNSTTFAFVRTLITNAILFFEPRIDLKMIEFNIDRQLEGVLEIHLKYEVRSTNSRFNFVYPFYLEEAERVERQSLGSLKGGVI